MKAASSNQKKESGMGFGLIAAGFVFLFNPVYHVIDVLPDFIGFILMWKGLGRLSALEYDLEDSRSLIKWLVVTEIIKPFTVIFMRGSGTAGVNTPDNLLPIVHDNTKLLMTFVFSVIELILFIPAIKKMFSGLDRLGIKYSSASLNAADDRKVAVREGKSIRFVQGKRDRSRKVYGIILVFYIARVFFTFACELPALQMYEFTGYVDSRTVDMTRFKNIFYVFSSFIVVIFGVVYLYYTLSFFRSVRLDRDLNDKLAQAYDAYLGAVPHVKTASLMNTSSVLFVIGMIATVALFGSSVQTVAGIMCALFVLLASLFFLRRRNMRPLAVIAAVCGVFYAILSFFGARYSDLYYNIEGYGMLDPLHFDEAARIYWSMAAVKAAGYIVIGIGFISFAYAYYRTVLKDINGLGVEGSYSYLPTYDAEEYRAALPGSVRIRAAVTMILGGVNFLLEAGTAYFILAPDSLSDFLGGLYFAVCVAWLISLMEFFRFVRAEVYYPLADAEKRRRS